MSSKLTQISIALLLSAVVAPSVSATVILSPEEEQAVRTAQPATVKKIAQDAVSTATATGIQSNLDAYEQRLGGSEEQIKDKIGVGGFTSILEDLGTVAQQANPGGATTQTVQAAIAANNNADAAVTARIGAAPATGTVLGDLDQQIDRIAAGNVVMKTAIDTTIQRFGVSNPAGADLNADLATERTNLINFLDAQAAAVGGGGGNPAYTGAGLVLTAGPGFQVDPAAAANTIRRMLGFIITKNLA